METARFLAEKAVTLDAELPQARWVLSRILVRRKYFDGERALAEIRKAISLDPNFADAHVYLGNILVLVGRAEEALGHVERGMRLNPHFPFWYYHILGMSQFQLTRYEAAAENLKKSIERNPNAAWPHNYLVSAYGHLGQMDDAEWEIGELDAMGYKLTLNNARQAENIGHPGYMQRYLDGLRKAGVPEE